MTFKEFYVEYWKKYNTAKVDTPLGLTTTSHNPNYYGGAVLPAQVSGSAPNELPLWSGGWGATNYGPFAMDFDLKMPETKVTGQIVNLQNTSTNKGGYDSHKPLIMMIQHPKDKHGRTQSIFYVPHNRVAKMTNKPEIGKTATVVLQRRPENADGPPSQIQSIQVF